MWNELAVLFVPQVCADILLQLVAHLCPLLLFGCIAFQFQIIVQSQDHHGIVVNIDGKMGILVDLDAPRMFRLHIAPVGCCRTDQQSVLLVILLVEEIFQRPFHPFEDRFAFNLRLQIGRVAAPLYIFINSLDQRNLLIRFHGVLVCRKARFRFRQAIFISTFFSYFRFLDIQETIYNIPGFPLEVKESIQIGTDGFVGHDFHGQFDKSIIVAYPDFSISVAGIKSAGSNLASHLVHLRH